MLTIKDTEVLNINTFFWNGYIICLQEKIFGDEIPKESLYETTKIIYERELNHK